MQNDRRDRARLAKRGINRRERANPTPFKSTKGKILPNLNWPEITDSCLLFTWCPCDFHSQFIRFFSKCLRTLADFIIAWCARANGSCPCSCPYPHYCMEIQLKMKVELVYKPTTRQDFAVYVHCSHSMYRVYRALKKRAFFLKKENGEARALAHAHTHNHIHLFPHRITGRQRTTPSNIKSQSENEKNIWRMLLALCRLCVGRDYFPFLHC